uniref:hypothetical protein n=1 Tax=Mycoplasmopsis bovis TaxID=28903 RepID=UPI003D2CE86F
MTIISSGGSRPIALRLKPAYSYLKKDSYIHDYIDIYDGEFTTSLILILVLLVSLDTVGFWLKAINTLLALANIPESVSLT